MSPSDLYAMDMHYLFIYNDNSVCLEVGRNFHLYYIIKIAVSFLSGLTYLFFSQAPGDVILTPQWIRTIYIFLSQRRFRYYAGSPGE